MLVGQRAMIVAESDDSSNDGLKPAPKTSETNQMLYIYDVSDDGKVDLVRKIDTKVKTSSLAAFLQGMCTIKSLILMLLLR